MSIDCTPSAHEILAEVRRRVAHRETQFRDDLLVLYAGCNVPPPALSVPFAASLDAMPAMGPVDNKEQPGTALIADLETALATVAMSLFGATWADARLSSCTLANLVVYHAFGERGNILAPAPGDGGHFSQIAGGTPAVAGLTARNLPFDARQQALDGMAAAKQIETVRPTLVVLGRSVILHPDDLGDVVCAAKSVGARTLYDASHVAGLIAGGVFPNPLDAGVDLMSMSTYKTLGGPPGAILAGRNPEDGDCIQRVIDGAFLANQAAARYPNLLAALLSLRDGSDEPRRVVANADAFKKALQDNGITVLLPDSPAGTHQVVVPIGTRNEAIDMMHRLEGAGILVGRCPVPGRPGQFGLRFGTQYVTRLGLGSATMFKAAGLISRLLVDTRESSASLNEAAQSIRSLLHSPPPQSEVIGS